MARCFTYLVVDCPGEARQVIVWDTLEIAVGRVADQDLVVPDSEVSRKHALFRMEGNAHTLSDLHTSNGTFVNGSQIRTHTLRPGDVVEIGPAKIQFRQEAVSPMGAGANVRFASQLKGFPEMPGGEGGKTVLGLAPDAALGDGLDLGEDLSHLGPAGELQFELGGDLLEPPPMPGAPRNDAVAVPEEVPPVLEIEGFAEEDDGLGDDLTEAALAELEKEEPPEFVPPSAPATAVRVAPRPQPQVFAPPPQPATAAPVAVQASAATPGPDAVQPARSASIQLQVEFEGPREALREVVAALLDREISIPPLKVRLRRPPRS
jgi:predicted component of type VI protein secretion system